MDLEFAAGVRDLFRLLPRNGLTEAHGGWRLASCGYRSVDIVVLVIVAVCFVGFCAFLLVTERNRPGVHGRSLLNETLVALRKRDFAKPLVVGRYLLVLIRPKRPLPAPVRLQ